MKAILSAVFAFFLSTMKNYNTVFDLCLLETVLSFLFSAILYLLNDSYANILFYVSIISLVITLLLGITGYFLNLFKTEDPSEEF